MTQIWGKTKDHRIKKRDGVYWARFMKKGKRVEESLGTKSFEIAKHKVQDIEAKLIIGRSWKTERQLFSEAWTEFLIDKKAGNKVRPAREKTLYEYASFGERFYKPFFGDDRVGDIDEHRYREFVAWIQEKFGSIQFANIQKYFSGFLTWAEAHGKIQPPRPYLFNPDAKADLEKEEYSPGKAYTKEQLRLMREAAEKYGPKTYLFTLMAQYMPFRPPKEITHLKKDRIHIDQNLIFLKKADTKTNKARTVPIHPIVRPLLIEQMKLSGDSKYLFPNAHIHAKPDAPMDRGGFRKAWAKILEAADVDGRVYDFRHTFITHALTSGMDPIAIAQMTGTSLKVMQDYYLHLSKRDYVTAIEKFEL